MYIYINSNNYQRNKLLDGIICGMWGISYINRNRDNIFHSFSYEIIGQIILRFDE